MVQKLANNHWKRLIDKNYHVFMHLSVVKFSFSSDQLHKTITKNVNTKYTKKVPYQNKHKSKCLPRKQTVHCQKWIFKYHKMTIHEMINDHVSVRGREKLKFKSYTKDWKADNIQKFINRIKNCFIIVDLNFMQRLSRTIKY